MSILEAPLPDPRRPSAKIENGANAHDSIPDAIIDREREAVAQAALIAEGARMDSAAVGQQIDVGEQTFEKVRSNPGKRRS